MNNKLKPFINLINPNDIPFLNQNILRTTSLFHQVELEGVVENNSLLKYLEKNRLEAEYHGESIRCEVRFIVFIVKFESLLC